jgi:hypothetical protein
MRNLSTTSVIGTFLVALALGSGCEQTPLTPGANFKMTLTANPTNVHVDATTPATSTIAATILSDTGVPQPGYSVYFTASSGKLDSTNAVKTGSDGRALDVLTVTVTDQTAITVTATATPLSSTVTVTQNGACDAGIAPVAVITNVPTTVQTGAAKSTVTVSPSGSSSTDTAPGTIVEYDWTCGNGTSATGATPTCSYTVGDTGTANKVYNITLIVKDDGCCGLGLACQKSSAPATETVTIGVTP